MKGKIYLNKGRWYSRCVCGMGWSSSSNGEGWEFVRINLTCHMRRACQYFSG